MLQNRPALKFCIPFMLGIVLGWEVSIPLWASGAACALCLLLALLANRIGTLLPPILMAVALTLFGTAKVTFDATTVDPDGIERFIRNRQNVILSGTVAELPSRTTRSVRFVIEAESLTVDGLRRRAVGGVLVSLWSDRVDAALPDSLTYGRRVTVAGELAEAGTARNPGEFDLRNYLHLHNIGARLFADRLDRSSLGAPASGNLLAAIVFPVRASASSRLDRLIGGEEGEFLKGLLIGERGNIPAEVKTSFINAGVMHIIAVSGLHVAIVTLMLFFLLQIVRIPEKTRIVMTAAFLVYYIYLTGAAPSVSRSVIMAIVFLGAKLFQRRSDMINTLACSALLLLLVDAKQLFQPGFQLSFVAVFSLITLYPRVVIWKNYLPRRLKESRVANALFAAVAVSIAAGIGTLPFTSVYFGKISLVSFAANIVVVPLSNVILGLGMLTVSLAYGWEWGAGIYAAVTSFLTWLLLKVVDVFGKAPFAYVDSHFTILSSMLFYGGVWVAFNLHRRIIRKWIVLLPLAAADLWLGAGLFRSTEGGTMRVTFMDVGQGDAIVVEFPDGKTLLVDAGPRTFSSDAGSRFVQPFLRYSGIRQLDAVILTHPHSDHLGGIPFVLRNCRVGEVLDAATDSRSALMAEYLRCVDSLKIPRKILRAGMVLKEFGGARLFVLHPGGSFVRRAGRGNSGFNNQSVVMKLCYGETSILLPGDIEQDAEASLVKSYGPFLRADILKIGHHGGATSSGQAFSELIHPAEAVISVGVNNKFGHPSPAVLRRLAMDSCSTVRTDESGAVVFESDGRRWRRVEWR